MNKHVALGLIVAVMACKTSSIHADAAIKFDSEFCTLAQITPTGAVTVDWGCIESLSNAFGPGSPYTHESGVVAAYVMKSIRAGKAKSKQEIIK